MDSGKLNRKMLFRPLWILASDDAHSFKGCDNLNRLRIEKNQNPFHARFPLM